MPPDKTKRRPRPGSGARTAESSPPATIHRAAVTGGRLWLPQADASKYEPVPGRGYDWLSIRCPFCQGVHLGRVRHGAVAGGPKRIPCGRVWVVVRRVYRPTGSAS
jgi:hypothetical protein